MDNHKKFEYRFSIGRIFKSIWYSLISHEWWGHFIFSFLGFLIIVIWAIIREVSLKNYSLTPIFDPIIAIIAFGLWGYVGFISIKNKFVPARKPLYGKSAVIFGLILLMSNLAFVIYAFYLLTEKLKELL